ncbi:MAG: adenylyltransferase/cytidyltransferase family protein [Candidatus Hydrogenedentota bacterium]
MSDSLFAGNRAHKEKTLDELAAIVARERSHGRTVVWTNGRFEILHAGHIEFFLKAARLGDIFMIGVNSDRSVRALKGPGHPLMPEEQRVAVLSVVSCVDYVTTFDETDCAHILRTLQPEVYAKGLRHLRGGIHEEERQVVQANGGCIALIGGDPNKSTTAIIERIRAADG